MQPKVPSPETMKIQIPEAKSPVPQIQYSPEQSISLEKSPQVKHRGPMGPTTDEIVKLKVNNAYTE